MRRELGWRLYLAAVWLHARVLHLTSYAMRIAGPTEVARRLADREHQGRRARVERKTW